MPRNKKKTYLSIRKKPIPIKVEGNVIINDVEQSLANYDGQTVGNGVNIFDSIDNELKLIKFNTITGSKGLIVSTQNDQIIIGDTGTTPYTKSSLFVPPDQYTILHWKFDDEDFVLPRYFLNSGTSSSLSNTLTSSLTSISSNIPDFRIESDGVFYKNCITLNGWTVLASNEVLAHTDFDKLTISLWAKQAGTITNRTGFPADNSKYNWRNKVCASLVAKQNYSGSFFNNGVNSDTAQNQTSVYLYEDTFDGIAFVNPHVSYRMTQKTPSITTSSWAVNYGNTATYFGNNLVTSINEWCHYALTFNGINTSLYKNGQCVYNEVLATSSSIFWGEVPGPWIIGHLSSSFEPNRGPQPGNTEYMGSSYGFSGSIADVRIENTCRSPYYLRRLYEVGKQRKYLYEVYEEQDKYKEITYKPYKNNTLRAFWYADDIRGTSWPAHAGTQLTDATLTLMGIPDVTYAAWAGHGHNALMSPRYQRQTTTWVNNGTGLSYYACGKLRFGIDNGPMSTYTLDVGKTFPITLNTSNYSLGLGKYDGSISIPKFFENKQLWEGKPFAAVVTHQSTTSKLTIMIDQKIYTSSITTTSLTTGTTGMCLGGWADANGDFNSPLTAAAIYGSTLSDQEIVQLLNWSNTHFTL